MLPTTRFGLTKRSEKLQIRSKILHLSARSHGFARIGSVAPCSTKSAAEREHFTLSMKAGQARSKPTELSWLMKLMHWLIDYATSEKHLGLLWNALAIAKGRQPCWRESDWFLGAVEDIDLCVGAGGAVRGEQGDGGKPSSPFRAKHGSDNPLGGSLPDESLAEGSVQSAGFQQVPCGRQCGEDSLLSQLPYPSFPAGDTGSRDKLSMPLNRLGRSKSPPHVEPPISQQPL